MENQPPNHRVVVTDFDMSFGSMVLFMVKWAFASIPALILIIGISCALVIGMGIGVGALTNLPGAINGLTEKIQATPTPTPAPAMPLKSSLTSTSDHLSISRVISRVDFGEQWPLTVEKARIWCEPGNALLLVSGQTTYNLNGTAVKIFGAQYHSIEEIWNGADMTPLVAAGRKLCQ